MSDDLVAQEPIMHISEKPSPDPEVLGQSTIFHDLERQALEELCKVGTLITAQENTVLCRQGDVADRLHVLIAGQVVLANTSSNGASAVVDVIRPGGHFILATVLARLPYLLNAYSVGFSRVAVFPADELRALAARFPALTSALMWAEARDFGELVRQVCDLKLRTTSQRLGCYLLSLAETPGGNTVNLRLPFDKRLLAARLGCRQENLSRAFAALRSFGVETHGARVTLHDIARLKEYAEPDDVNGTGFA